MRISSYFMTLHKILPKIYTFLNVYVKRIFKILAVFFFKFILVFVILSPYSEELQNFGHLLVFYPDNKLSRTRFMTMVVALNFSQMKGTRSQVHWLPCVEITGFVH